MKLSSGAATAFVTAATTATAVVASWTSSSSSSSSSEDRQDRENNNRNDDDYLVKAMKKNADIFKHLNFRLETNRLKNKNDNDEDFSFSDKENLRRKNNANGAASFRPCEPIVPDEEVKELLIGLKNKRAEIAAEDNSNLDYGLLPLPKSSSCGTGEICLSEKWLREERRGEEDEDEDEDEEPGACLDVNEWLSYSYNAYASTLEYDGDEKEGEEEEAAARVARDLEPAVEAQPNCGSCGFIRPNVALALNQTGYNMYELVAGCGNWPDKTFNNYGKNDVACPSNWNTLRFEDINCWDVAGVKDFSNTFYNRTVFNKELDCWDTSAATAMNGMFENARSFNRPLSTFNTKKVKNFYAMFYGNFYWNQDLNSWKTSKATDMKGMFYKNYYFNSPLDKWKTKKVKDMSLMFARTDFFNQDINKWKMDKVTSISRMFYKTFAFNSPLDKWKTKKLQDMSYVFKHAKYFEQDIDSWNTREVVDMTGAFSNYDHYTYDEATGQYKFHGSYFNQPLDSWNTMKVVKAPYMFVNTIFNQPLISWDLSNAKRLDYMFYDAYAFNQCLSSWALDVPNDVNLTTIFYKSNCPQQSDPIVDQPPWCQRSIDGCSPVPPTPAPTAPLGPCDNNLIVDCKDFAKEKKQTLGKKCDTMKEFGQKMKDLCPKQCKNQLCKSGCPDKGPNFKFKVKDGKETLKLTCDTLPVDLCSKKDKKGFVIGMNWCPQKCGQQGNCLA